MPDSQKSKRTTSRAAGTAGAGSGRPKGRGPSKKKDLMTSRPSQDKRHFTSKRDDSTQDPDLKRTHHRATDEQKRLGQERPKDFKTRKLLKDARKGDK
jgi:hypothetical protein